MSDKFNFLELTYLSVKQTQHHEMCNGAWFILAMWLDGEINWDQFEQLITKAKREFENRKKSDSIELVALLGEQ